MTLHAPKMMALVFAGLPFLLAGCGGEERPDLVPVSGVVTYQGKPVVGAEVVFHNDDAPRAASGVTDAQGKFRLTSYEDFDGAVPGECIVTVAKVETDAAINDANAEDPSAAYGEGMMAAASGDMSEIAKNELPEKYADPSTSGLTVTIKKEGPNDNIELKLE